MKAKIKAFLFSILLYVITALVCYYMGARENTVIESMCVYIIYLLLEREFERDKR